MAELISTIQQIQAARVFVVMVYLQEAHADDLWPLGYGIKSHANIDERLAACKQFLENHPRLKQSLNGVAVDTMADSFLHTYGAWPERYFLAELSGRILWASAAYDQDEKGHTCSVLQQVLNVVEQSARPVGDGWD
mmetsp:Transcript_11213/g.19684  ORF Transcript_11213/g.19684 Transcript_11213/m.19684 type:complete len:136 (-) Transcript_11213:29-436(-)